MHVFEPPNAWCKPAYEANMSAGSFDLGAKPSAERQTVHRAVAGLVLVS